MPPEIVHSSLHPVLGRNVHLNKGKSFHIMKVTLWKKRKCQFVKIVEFIPG